jgi:hypothetical protein
MLIRVLLQTSNTTDRNTERLMRASTHPTCLLLLVGAAAVLAAPGFVDAGPAVEATDVARSAVAQMTPHEVGSRYGQALGAIEICPGAQTTAKVPALNTLYTGADLQTFKAQATKIYDAWIKLKQCAIVDDPSECRVVIEESCAAATTEIGPSGTVFPGLLGGPLR